MPAEFQRISAAISCEAIRKKKNGDLRGDKAGVGERRQNGYETSRRSLFVVVATELNGSEASWQLKSYYKCSRNDLQDSKLAINVSLVERCRLPKILKCGWNSCSSNGSALALSK